MPKLTHLYVGPTLIIILYYAQYIKYSLKMIFHSFHIFQKQENHSETNKQVRFYKEGWIQYK